jgi:prolyl 4-hydroxylase
MSVIFRVWCLIIPLLLIFKFHEALGSYAGSTSAIIDPTKVKQVSWKPRSLSQFQFAT